MQGRIEVQKGHARHLTVTYWRAGVGCQGLHTLTLPNREKARTRITGTDPPGVSLTGIFLLPNKGEAARVSTDCVVPGVSHIALANRTAVYTAIPGWW
jgi:hypothetical protein